MRTTLGIFSLAVLAAAASDAADVKAGQAIYDKACKSCHGADGSPNAAVAKAMKVDMRDLKSPDVLAKSDSDLKKVITAGDGKMKPVKAVASGGLDDVVAYLRSLKK